MKLTNEQKIAKVRDFRPIDDVFFEVLAGNPKVCQEMLRTILEDDGLVVTEVITQSDERNLYGRSVRLDALCTLGNGSKVNVEVQRLKETEGGVQVVCEVMQRYEKIAVDEAMHKERMERIKDLIRLNCSQDFIIRAGYTEDEYAEAEMELCRKT